MQKIYSNGTSIEVEPFDLESRGSLRKLDLLYYNSINRHGEVLSSLVYNSGLRLATDLNPIHYEPNRLFNNTSFERSYALNETSFVWKNSTVRTGFTSLLKDVSYSASNSFPHFNTSTDYAVQYSNGEYAYDGWYTVVSVDIPEVADGLGSPLGKLRYNASTEVVEYANQDSPISDSHWTELTDIDPTIPIYDFMYIERGEYFEKSDFMITVKTRTYYKKLLDKKLDMDWFSQMSALGPKIRTLETSVEHEVYDISQHVIISINNSLLSLLI